MCVTVCVCVCCIEMTFPLLTLPVCAMLVTCFHASNHMAAGCPDDDVSMTLSFQVVAPSEIIKMKIRFKFDHVTTETRHQLKAIIPSQSLAATLLTSAQISWITFR